MDAVERFATINYNELIRRGYFVKFVKVSGRRLFLIDKTEKLSKTGKQFQIIMREKYKVPLGKRVIDAQMGKIPQLYETKRVWNLAVELPMPKGGNYPAWEIV